MKRSIVRIHWPNGQIRDVPTGSEWITVANQADINIPTGCLRGSCGACEIEVNGEVLRACIAKVKFMSDKNLHVSVLADEIW